MEVDVWRRHVGRQKRHLGASTWCESLIALCDWKTGTVAASGQQGNKTPPNPYGSRCAVRTERQKGREALQLDIRQGKWGHDTSKQQGWLTTSHSSAERPPGGQPRPQRQPARPQPVTEGPTQGTHISVTGNPPFDTMHVGRRQPSMLALRPSCQPSRQPLRQPSRQPSHHACR